ncbi:MAG: hypothetical protein KDB01_17415 [Planctomycetaceae bacterium]|nr:hypothetical protein [Planctomycetaceae bacterium]
MTDDLKDSMDSRNPVVVESFMDSLNATLALLWLTQNGIKATLAGDALAHMLTHVVAAQDVQLQVPADDAERAAELLVEFHAANASASHGPWQCPSCRELCGASFDECWQCGHDFEERFGITELPAE